MLRSLLRLFPSIAWIPASLLLLPAFSLTHRQTGASFLASSVNQPVLQSQFLASLHLPHSTCSPVLVDPLPHLDPLLCFPAAAAAAVVSSCSCVSVWCESVCVFALLRSASCLFLPATSFPCFASHTSPPAPPFASLRSLIADSVAKGATG